MKINTQQLLPVQFLKAMDRFDLSRREIEIAFKLSADVSVKQISEDLKISRRTVEMFKTSLRRKLDVHTTAAAIAKILA